MAPNRYLRTYSRGNNSSVSCLDAFNILFAKNLTQRKLHSKALKGKSKLQFEIKELPAKIKTILNDESSLQVNFNDTFDNLLKEPCKNVESGDVRVEIIAREETSCSVIKHLSNLNNVSPMVQKLRSFRNKSSGKNSSWFYHPTPPREGISNMLEIEKGKKGYRLTKKSTSETDRSSPVLLRSHIQTSPKTNCGYLDSAGDDKKFNDFTHFSKDFEKKQSFKTMTFTNNNFSFNPIFTNSVREQILIHSSTPVAPWKRQQLIRRPISPISNEDALQNCIVDSLEEIKNWNMSLPKINPLKNSTSKTQPSQNLSFSLEDFELFTEQLRSKSLKAKAFERIENNLRGSSITLDDFENFHKKFISSQVGNQSKLIRSISLKEFESFYESYQKNMSFNKNSFFDSCHKAFNYVTHRKHRLPLSPKFLQCSRSSKKYNLKDLVVVLDNKILNYSNSKWRKQETLVEANDINKKQLTVQLTRLSLNKLKPLLNQSQKQPILKAKSKQYVKKFKACRKFSSNCKDVCDKSSMVTAKPIGKILLKPGIKLSRSYFSDHTRAAELGMRNENYKKNYQSEKENEITSGAHPKWFEDSRKSCPEFLNSSRSGSKYNNIFTKKKYMNQISISKSENRNIITTDKVINICTTEQSILPCNRSNSATKKISDIEKAYVAKILLASTSDSSIELQETQESPILRSKYSSPERSILFPDNNKGLIYRSSASNLKVKDGQNTHMSKDRSGMRLTRICKSNGNMSYVAQDLSASILLNSRKCPTTFESTPLKANPLSTSKIKLTQHTSSICQRSHDNLNNKSDSVNMFDNHESIKKTLFGIQNGKHSMDLSSSIRNDQIEDSPFKVPLISHQTLKPPKLRTGKSWRRSLMQHKKKSFVDLDRESCDGFSNQLKLNHCQSAKMLPSEETNRLRRRTALQSYVYSSMVADGSINDVIIQTPKTLHKPLSVATARDMVLLYCGQTVPMPFEKMYPDSLLKDCKKIGEGVYGEVFFYSHACGNFTVMKVIPVEGDTIINGEKQKKFHEILSEIVIVSQLSSLRNNVINKTSGFCEVQRIACVRGKYPKILLDLWYAYDKTKGSENEPPDLFDDDQLYIILELANGGQDLEAFLFNNASQAVAMFKQVAYALAIGEEQLQFEHRDLHWGNILVRTVDKTKKAVFKYKGKVKECQTQGVEATIIDFTLSRIAHEGVVIYNDLGQDPELFMAKGDYQFDVYRLMKEHNKNNWQSFTPYSNVLWLHYVLRKSITALRYKNTKSKVHKKFIELLKTYETNILSYNCVSEFVNVCL